MEKEIAINVSQYETRIALLEDKKLVELWVERPEQERIVGDIYKGIVKSIFPGMQAAFVDIGIGKNVFLHVSDIAPQENDFFEIEIMEDEMVEFVKKRPHVNIQDVLKKEQEILVQIVREPIDTKGARVTTQVSLPGRYIVLAPGEDYIAVSRKITDWSEKKRLKKIISELKPRNMAVIIRTVGVGKDKRDFKADLKNLLRRWHQIRKQSDRKPAPVLLHKEMSATFGVMRDFFTPDIDRVWVDNKDEYKKILKYVKSFARPLVSKLMFYQAEIPLFDALNIETDIDKMLERKVWIKKGSYVVIDHTEAMVTIDVNTGRFVGRSSQEDTVLKTNLEAAKEIARQIRLRDLGGLIVVDFIDMESREHRRRLFEEFKNGFRNDRAKNSILPISDFGLIQMTREKIRPSLVHALSELCPTCEGSGRILSKETVAVKIERWFRRARVGSEERRYKLILSPGLYVIFTQNDSERLRRLNKELRMEIQVEKDESLRPDQFKVYSPTEDAEVTQRFNP
ncbi:MAG: Ribonuclease, Rne/Rng family [candidate division Zixibacteria bacterium RBG-1]|nr:MAG: Ribonuclease, Rne/Rng family [candidate division Zixibacteria bacterium RBG-1]OGC83741.1 MAG: hypothetical protein A2V73_02195 [candidate division Zixibacteria bacterium RBG_19FT_COMBO_42_43]